MKAMINADDFGISTGVNLAVKKMFNQKKLNSASLICGCKYFDSAIQIASEIPDLKIGLHFNLTTGNSTNLNSTAPLLADKNNKFKNGFVKLLFLSIFKKKEFLQQVEDELEAQIKLLKNHKIIIDHINGHRHIHYIPGILKVVENAAKKHQIPYIRIINESFFYSWNIGGFSYLFNGGIIKWLILRCLGLINGSTKINSPRYFFSILYTCQISKELIAKIKMPKKFTEIEIMIHPGNPDIDKELKDLEERPHLLSQNRYLEQL